MHGHMQIPRPRLLPCLALLLLPSLLLRTAAARSLHETDAGANSRCKPRRVHTALGDEQGSVRVVWDTDEDGCEASMQFARPAGATSGGQASTQWMSASNALSYSMTDDDMCSGRAQKKQFAKYFHTATIGPLDPGQPYLYRIQGDDMEYELAPPVPRNSEKLEFIALADMGWGHKHKHPMAPVTMETIEAEHERRPIDLVVHIGDLSYADGKSNKWDVFMDVIEPVASTVPYMVTVGNHEYAYEGGGDRDPSGVDVPYRPDWGNFGDESGGECGVAVANNFLMPGSARQRTTGATAVATFAAAAPATAEQAKASRLRRLMLDSSAAAAAILRPQHSGAGSGSGSGGDTHAAGSNFADDNPPFWYSFAYGPVKFVVLCTEHDVSPGSRQYEWLQATLQAVDRCATPWLVVLQHRPMYVVFPHKSNVIVGDHLRDFLEGLFLEYKVDLVLSGHVHSNFRTCSVAHMACTPDGSGITHIVMGTGGHKLSEVEDEQRLWMKSAVLAHGFGRFSIDGDRLSYEFVRSEDGSVADHVKLLAQVHGVGCSAFMASRRTASMPDTDVVLASASPDL